MSSESSTFGANDLHLIEQERGLVQDVPKLVRDTPTTWTKNENKKYIPYAQDQSYDIKSPV